MRSKLVWLFCLAIILSLAAYGCSKKEDESEKASDRKGKMVSKDDAGDDSLENMRE